MTEDVASKADPQQTYTLFLPASYDAAKKYPLLLIFDPRGRGTLTAKRFADAADEYGWILISSNGTRSDEAWDPNERALRALWPEVARYSADPRRIYATGFSGTVMAAWALGVRTGGLAGVIAVGGRFFSEDFVPAKFPFAYYGFAGDTDFNNREMRAIDAQLEEAKKPHRFRSFEGPHSWMPPELVRDAFGWMELWAMKQQRRAPDEALVAKLYAEDLAAAKTLRDYRAILETYEGLRDVEEVRATVARLDRDPAVLREQQEEAKADEFESRYVKETMSRIPKIFGELRATPDESFRATRRLLHEFKIADLKKRAAKPGADGAAAKRILEAVYAQMAFYLPRQLEERGERDLAEATRKMAAEIRR